ncbi:hypothetical protein QTG54_015817 [Skeletonema marinoi]|uniref:Uncharacterized protein n=1 Tax=Skeletonema marinoi TaxID=267567 RepID=A0AAD9D5A8_9STRA|nr:hypothetical protein QTG54_015817 [Skeletonema marinoi]
MTSAASARSCWEQSPFDDVNEEEFDEDDFLMEYEINSEDPALEGVDTAAVTPIIKDTLVRKQRDELMKQRSWKKFCRYFDPASSRIYLS